jgi:hypothetical protein
MRQLISLSRLSLGLSDHLRPSSLSRLAASRAMSSKEATATEPAPVKQRTHHDYTARCPLLRRSEWKRERGS